METALEILIPRIVPGAAFEIRRFNGKPDLLRKLPDRLKGYSRWISKTRTAVVVVVDRDDDDCRKLKIELDAMAVQAGLDLASVASHMRGLALNRLAIEELEAWFFGDTQALTAAYPGIPPTIGGRRRFREPDNIRGGTWEALEQVLQQAGYHKGGLAKIQAARDICDHINVENNASPSFAAFRDGLRFLIGGPLVA